MPQNGKNAFIVKFKLVKENLESQLKKAKKISLQSSKKISKFSEKVEEIMKEKEEVEKILAKQKEIEAFCKRLESHITKIDEAKLLIEKGEEILAKRSHLDGKITDVDGLIEKLKEIPARIFALEEKIPSMYAKMLSEIDAAANEFKDAQKLVLDKIEATKAEYKKAFDTLAADVKEIRDTLLGPKFDEFVKTAGEIKAVYLAERELLTQIESKIHALKAVVFESAELVPYVEERYTKARTLPEAPTQPTQQIAKVERPIPAWRIALLSALISVGTALFVTNASRISNFAQSSLSKAQQVITQIIPKIEIKFEERGRKAKEVKEETKEGTKKEQVMQPIQPTQQTPLVFDRPSISPVPKAEKEVGESKPSKFVSSELSKKTEAKVQAQVKKAKPQPKQNPSEATLSSLIAELKSAEYWIGITLAQKLEKLAGTGKEGTAVQLIKEMKEYLIKSGKWNGSWNEYQIKAVEDLLISNGVIEE